MGGVLRQLFPALLLVLGATALGVDRRAFADQATAVPDSLRIELLAQADGLTAIYQRGDWPALKLVLAPGYLGTAPGQEWDASQLEREFPKVKLIDFVRHNATVKPLGVNVVLLNEDGFLRETYADQDISGWYRFTTIWTRVDGRWRLLFEQEVPIPDPRDQ
jgi:hypothetical protein